MTREALADQLKAWVRLVAPSPLTKVPGGAHLVTDLGLDSLAIAELTSKVRLELGLQLEPAEVRDRLQVDALIDAVWARLKDRS